MSAQAAPSHAAWLMLPPLLCVCVNHYLPCLQLNGTSWRAGLCDVVGEGGAGKEAAGGGREERRGRV